MVNAGRVLIIPKGTWSNLQNYEMLDLVSLDGVAYLARAASVGQNPSTDTSMTYWQPFGTASEIATTSKPGLVMPDGQTITIDAAGLIQANLGISDLNNVTITSIANGQILVYDSTAGAWKNSNLSVSAGDVNYNNQASGLTATKVQGAIDEVSSQMQTLESKIGAVTVKTLAANATNISFTVPTTGNNLIEFWCSDGSDYTEIDTSVSGTVTLTFEASASARSVSCRIAAVSAS